MLIPLRLRVYPCSALYRRDLSALLPASAGQLSSTLFVCTDALTVRLSNNGKGHERISPSLQFEARQGVRPAESLESRIRSWDVGWASGGMRNSGVTRATA